MSTQPRLTIGDAAPDSVLLDPTGQTVHLRDFWQAGPLLFSMLRHFG